MLKYMQTKKDEEEHDEQEYELTREMMALGINKSPGKALRQHTQSVIGGRHGGSSLIPGSFIEVQSVETED